MFSKAQFVVSENLPDHVMAGVSQNFTISVNKGNYTGFATYWINAAPNITLRVTEVSGATVMDQDNRITLTWVSFPKDQEVIQVVFSIESTINGEVELPNAFTWVESEAKMEMDLPPIVFVTDANPNGVAAKKEVATTSPATVAVSVQTPATNEVPQVAVTVSETPAPAAQEKQKEETPAVQVNTQVQAPANTQTPEPTTQVKVAVSTETSAPVTTPVQNAAPQPTQTPASNQPRASITRIKPNLSPEELRMQISQLKHDAHEASKVGELEKRTAEARLQLAISDSARAAKAKDKAAMESAMVEANKARGDLEVAKSIIKLSHDLTHDANEIEKQNAEKLAGLAPIADYSKKETPKQKAARLRTEAAASIASGERLRADAQTRMQEAMNAEASANALAEGEERETALATAKKNKTQAEADLKKADQMIRAGQDIEAQAQAMDPQKKSALAAQKPEPKVENKQKTEPTESTPAEPKMSWREKKAKEREEKRLAKEEKQRLKKEEEEKLAKGDYFTVQIGAFAGKPDMRALRKAGKTFTVNEDGKTKVLCGRYATKEAAVKRKAELEALGIPGYVVAYTNGQRVR